MRCVLVLFMLLCLLKTSLSTFVAEHISFAIPRESKLHVVEDVGLLQALLGKIYG